jgi:3-dehydroquinate dehydratase / shikimate dehydrogenase
VATLVCVPIKVMDAPTALAEAGQARDAGADLIEFRVDHFFTGASGPEGQVEQDAVVALVSASPLPCVVTCRPIGPEGGEYDGEDAPRIALFERLAIAVGQDEHPPRYIDIELATFERSANIRQKIKLAVDHPEQIRDLRTSLIMSTHDFQGRPADLFRRLARMRSEPAAAVHKIAYVARSLRDNLDLFDLLSEAERPTIALGMGQFGLMSRVLAPKFGGFMTFASLRPAAATAPGQPTITDLLDRYRMRSIKPSTRVFGVVGFPVEHSMSPAVHNAGFEAIREWKDAAGESAGGVYLPLPVPPEYEHFKATVLAFVDHPKLTFTGCSVTIPHKQNLVRLAKEEAAAGRAWSMDRLSELCGAANTLMVERDSQGNMVRCKVLNTDVPAATGLLRESMGELKGKRIGILGTGGVARGIAFGVVSEGASVIIFGRSPEKSKELAEALRPIAAASAEKLGAPVKISTEALEAAPTSFCDACVNCTPIGMKGGPAPDASPLRIGELAIAFAEVGGAPPVVMDTVYNPLETPMLAAAKTAGFQTIEGLGMFVAQATEQFRAWTGQGPPAGLFEGVARQALFGHNSG